MHSYQSYIRDSTRNFINYILFTVKLWPYCTWYLACGEKLKPLIEEKKSYLTLIFTMINL